MDLLLHHEIDVTVVAVQPWGLDVECHDGTQGFVDNAKSPGWGSGEHAALVGRVVHAVVIDDQRRPARLSMLQVDMEIAHRLRSAEGR